VEIHTRSLSLIWLFRFAPGMSHSKRKKEAIMILKEKEEKLKKTANEKKGKDNGKISEES